MKHCLAIFFCLTQALFAFSQDTLLLEQLQSYSFDGTLTSISSYTHNSEGLLTSSNKYMPSENYLIENKYQHDSLDRTVLFVSYENKDLYDSIIYKYESEELSKETRFLFSGLGFFNDEGFQKWISTYNHERNSKTTLWYEYFPQGDYLKLLNEQRTYYNSEGNIIADSVIMLQQARITYDEKGNFKSEIADIIQSTAYEYNNSNVIRKSDFYNGVLNFYVNYEYDYQNRLILEEQINYDKGDTLGYILNKYTYRNEKGNTLKIRRTEGKGISGWSESTYNDSGKIIKDIFKDFRDGSVISERTYEYDENGYLLIDQYQYFADELPLNSGNDDARGHKTIYVYGEYQK